MAKQPTPQHPNWRWLSNFNAKHLEKLPINQSKSAVARDVAYETDAQLFERLLDGFQKSSLKDLAAKALEQPYTAPRYLPSDQEDDGYAD